MGAHGSGKALNVIPKTEHHLNKVEELSFESTVFEYRAKPEVTRTPAEKSV